MNTILKAIAAILLAALIVLGVTFMANAGEIGISSGPKNLGYNAVIARIKKGCPDLDITNHTSTGGSANLNAMRTIAGVRYGIAPYDAIDFNDRKNHGLMMKVYAFLPLYKNALQVLASDKSGIKTIQDTNGKRGNIGPAGSGSWASSQIMANILELNWITSTYSTSESLKKLQAGELDFIVYFSGVPTPDLVALGKDAVGIHLVDVYDKRLESSKYYDITEIAGGTYAFDDHTVRVPQVQNYLVSLKATSPEKEADDEALFTCIVKNVDKWSDEDVLFRGVDLMAKPKWQSHPLLEKFQRNGGKL